MSTKLKVVESEPAGFSLNEDTSGVTVDELSKKMIKLG
jgi:hypothetical protein